VPVVGSDSGEIPNVLGDAGVLVPEGDAGALAAAIRMLRDDGGKRRELGEKARQRVLGRFTQERVARQTLEVYAEIIEESK
jgi:glycosyltransferase involved in cell wall biosynthesis